MKVINKKSKGDAVIMVKQIIISILILVTLGNRISFLKAEEKSSGEKTQISSELQDFQSQADFFKGGIIKKGEKYYGVYIAEKGDNVWVIAIKYAKYLKGENYTKKDVGNISYWINKVNYAHYEGGVKNNIKIGEKVLVPVQKIYELLYKK